MGKKTILVVDDAPENLDLLVGLLREKYRVKAAINGDIALKIAGSQQPPDLILLDIVMPGKDGIEVCEILKNDENTKHIPIIFLSGKASGEDCERGMELGGAAYLKKPVETESLFSLLEVVLPE
jgi:putative two-component system response regulator